MEKTNETSPAVETILDGSRFIRACLRRPVDRMPVWFLRQAGRYMQEYRDARKHHTLVEICKHPDLAGGHHHGRRETCVDAAIIFADLLLPLEPMGLDFEFQAGEALSFIIQYAPPMMSVCCASIAPRTSAMHFSECGKACAPQTSLPAWRAMSLLCSCQGFKSEPTRR
jgi:hypothetical protein